MKGKSTLHWLWLSMLVLAMDQLSKLYIVSMLTTAHTIEVLPFLKLVLTYNKGVAFSFLNNLGEYGRWGLSLVSILISIVLLRWLALAKSGQKLLCLSLSLIVGGAVGNIIDRIRIGSVIDFIDVYYEGWHWPAFNIADSAICIGAAILLVTTIKASPEKTI